MTDLSSRDRTQARDRTEARDRRQGGGDRTQAQAGTGRRPPKPPAHRRSPAASSRRPSVAADDTTRRVAPSDATAARVSVNVNFPAPDATDVSGPAAGGRRRGLAPALNDRPLGPARRPRPPADEGSGGSGDGRGAGRGHRRKDVPGPADATIADGPSAEATIVDDAPLSDAASTAATSTAAASTAATRADAPARPTSPPAPTSRPARPAARTSPPAPTRARPAAKPSASARTSAGPRPGSPEARALLAAAYPGRVSARTSQRLVTMFGGEEPRERSTARPADAGTARARAGRSMPDPQPGPPLIQPLAPPSAPRPDGPKVRVNLPDEGGPATRGTGTFGPVTLGSAALTLAAHPEEDPDAQVEDEGSGAREGGLTLPWPRHLRVVETKPKRELSPAAKRHLTRILLVAAAVGSAFVVLGLVYLHVMSTEKQFKINRLDNTQTQLAQKYQDLRQKADEDVSPQRVIQEADGIGMVLPASPEVAQAPAKARTGAPTTGKSTAGNSTAGNSTAGNSTAGKSTTKDPDQPRLAPAGVSDWPRIKADLVGGQ